MTLPKALKKTAKTEDNPEKKTGYPVEQLSASAMIKLSTNPILFKINYINRDQFDTAMSVSGVLGKAFHYGMEVYYGGSDTLRPTNEAEAIEYGLKAGMEFLEKYNDGFINYTDSMSCKQDLFDKFTFCFNEYVKQWPYKPDTILATEEKILEHIDIEWKGERLELPIKLKGYLDKVIREDGKLIIEDYKTCGTFSNPDKIDGAKMIQAVQYYLLAYAKYGEAPYSLRFKEVKHTKNSDASKAKFLKEHGFEMKQTQMYEIVFAENELYFSFYFRFYEDVVRALNGEQVYLPNVHTLFDNEVSIIAYIHRLDEPENTAKLMRKHQVHTLTELLKKEMQSTANMRKLMKMAEKSFVSAKNINYESMKNEEKIQTKMMEHGMMLTFNDVIQGASVDLYRYMPTIGLKMSRLRNYADDIELVLGVSGVRILAPIPGTTFVGIEVPRKERTFPNVPEGNTFEVAIGQTIMGETRRYDLRESPHTLIAGAAGSGKSVALSSIITQLSRIPAGCEMHLYDPKIVELSIHKKDKNVVEYHSDPIAIQKSLSGMTKVMDERYEELARAGVRKVDEYKGNMPAKFLIVDEFGDLFLSTKDGFIEWEFCKNHQKINDDTRGDLRYLMTTKKSLRKAEMEAREGVEMCQECTKLVFPPMSEVILKLAQKGRACGIHLIMATQRPSVTIINGDIKANFPTKLAFRTSKAVDSKIILDEEGAEKLLGKGDMLFAGDNGIERLQGFNL